MPIYTKTGDFGETSLFGGKRVLKCDELVDLYGLIDELNSSIGLIISLISLVGMREFLWEIQKDLFTIGSFIAGANINLRHITTRVNEMEERIDTMEKTLVPLHHFILPGGTKLASYIHVVRSVARRVERHVVALKKTPFHTDMIEKKQVDQIITYVNRLSDFLFILARFINKQEHVIEMVWDGASEEGRHKSE